MFRAIAPSLICHFSITLPLALIPIPSLLIFIAKDTTLTGFLILDIGIPVLALS